MVKKGVRSHSWRAVGAEGIYPAYLGKAYEKWNPSSALACLAFPDAVPEEFKVPIYSHMDCGTSWSSN